MVSTHMRGAVIPTSVHKGFPSTCTQGRSHTVPRFFCIQQGEQELRAPFNLTLDFMEISYEVKKKEMASSAWGCFASCCWRYATGSQGEI